MPAGIFLIGSLETKSNVTLQIAAGGTLLGSGHSKDYHAVDAIPLYGDSTLEDGNWALIYAVNAKDVTIEGPGTIDGQGRSFIQPCGVPSHPAGWVAIGDHTTCCSTKAKTCGFATSTCWTAHTTVFV